MFFVLTRRVVRHAIGRQAGDRFAARHDNRETDHVSGPFAKRALADRAALAALATHTCLSAQVYSLEQLEALAQRLRSHAGSYDLQALLAETLRRHGPMSDQDAGR